MLGLLGCEPSSDPSDEPIDQPDAGIGEPPEDDDLVAACAQDPALPGDTRPCTVMTYPADAFHGSGGRIIDVTRPPFNAKGDGVADDTAALRAAYDFVLGELDRVGWDNFFPKCNRPYVLYLPDGTYRVRDTIIYSGALRDHYVGNTESLAWIRIVGQSRARTIIRLDDAVPAFAAGQPARPVVSFGRSDFNNLPASNSLRNLTVSIGAGNPSAIGVKFGGANYSDITNVRILSEDPALRGAIGLDDSIGTVLGFQRDLIVRGFDVGIRMLPYHFTMPSLEHITLSGQRVAGVQVVDGAATVRKLRSVNRVPAILVSGAGGHAVVTDSELTGGAPDQPAVKIAAGHFFGRDLAVDGYGAGVEKGGAVAVAGDVDEYVSDQVVRFDGASPTRSLELPVEEIPMVAWDTLDQWVKPATPGDGVADASPAIRAAMAAGRSTIYFPGFEYRMASTVVIPCSVKRLSGMFTSISGSGVKFQVAACPDPLLVEDLENAGGIGFEHVGLRPLVLSRINSRAFVYRNSVTGGTPTLFGNMVTGLKSANPLHHMRAFLRSTDGESLEGQLKIDAADVWVFGFKSEKSASTNGKASGSEGFETLVRDTQDGTTRSIRWDSPLVPDRVGRPHNEIIPLYLSAP